MYYSNGGSIGMVYYVFSAFDSGTNATIICKKGDTCIIECHENACNTLKMICDGDCQFEINCINAQKSVICLMGYNFSYDYGSIINDHYNYNLPNKTISNIDNSLVVCNQSSTSMSILCENSMQCIGGTIDSLFIANATSTVCCTAHKSCADTDNITVSLNSNVTTVAIRCDSKYACSNISDYVIAKNGGDIYMSAYYSSSQYTILSSDVISTIGGDHNYNSNIFCTGYTACVHQTIEDANKLFCSGANSCYQAKNIRNIINVYVTGETAAYASSFEDIAAVVYCLAIRSCWNSAFHNASVVYGDGYQVLQHSVFDTINKAIIGIGFQSLYGISVTSATKVCLMYNIF